MVEGDLTVAGAAGGTAAFLLMVTGADLSISGLAGLVDEQSAAAADGHRGVDDDLRVACSVAEHDELSVAVGRAGGRRIGQTLWWKSWRSSIDAAKAGEFDAIEHVRRQNEVIAEQKRCQHAKQTRRAHNNGPRWPGWAIWFCRSVGSRSA